MSCCIRLAPSTAKSRYCFPRSSSWSPYRCSRSWQKLVTLRSGSWRSCDATYANCSSSALDRVSSRAWRAELAPGPFGGRQVVHDAPAHLLDVGAERRELRGTARIDRMLDVSRRDAPGVVAEPVDRREHESAQPDPDHDRARDQQRRHGDRQRDDLRGLRVDLVARRARARRPTRPRGRRTATGPRRTAPCSGRGPQCSAPGLGPSAPVRSAGPRCPRAIASRRSRAPRPASRVRVRPGRANAAAAPQPAPLAAPPRTVRGTARSRESA